MYHKHFKLELFTFVIFQLATNPSRWNARYQKNNERSK